ncbi:MAG: HAD-IA family hydrolase [Christensenellaceae bacterium]|nr:HAD-IA family hydrolase [Christensenellaceae bacterium]
MIRNLIWDFDGTLFDTYPVSGGNFQRCIEDAYGVKEDVSEIMAKMKNSFDTAMEFYANKYGFGQDFCRAFYHVNDTSTPDLAKPFSGVREFCLLAKEKGCRHFLYTHRDELTKEMLKKHGLYDCFSGFITSADAFPRKPAPDAINYLLEKYGMAKDDAVMIGDREIDILAGKNAGIYACLFFPENGAFPKTAADFKIREIMELKKVCGV